MGPVSSHLSPRCNIAVHQRRLVSLPCLTWQRETIHSWQREPSVLDREKLTTLGFRPFRYEGNVDDFLRQSAQMHKGTVNIIHSSFDPVDIRVHENRATSDAFCLVTSSLTLNDIDYELASHMRLFTRLQRLSDPPHEWRIVRLESAYVRDRLVTAFPSFVDPALLPAMTDEMIEAYPKAYRYLALVMSLRGLKPRRDLPHEGAPASVKRLADQNRAFLNNNDDGGGGGAEGTESI